MSRKHPSRYTPEDVYDLESRGLKLASKLDGEQKELVSELCSVLLNQAIRLAQIRMALKVNDDA